MPERRFPRRQRPVRKAWTRSPPAVFDRNAHESVTHRCHGAVARSRTTEGRMELLVLMVVSLLLAVLIVLARGGP